MEMVIVTFGHFDKWDAGVVEKNESHRGKSTEQLDQPGRCALVVLAISPDDRHF
jgi:hypothetical protein